MYPNLSFKLSDKIINEKKKALSSINFDPLAVFTLERTYHRNKYILDHNRELIYNGKENFFEVVERVVNGTFSILKDELTKFGSWDETEYEKQASYLFNLIYQFKMSPPGRGLWAMGTKMVHEKKVSMSLVNCTFISSKNIEKVKGSFFAYIMDTLMVGVGVGFDDRGAGHINIVEPEYAPLRPYNNKYDILSYINKIKGECKFKDVNGTLYIEHEYNYIRNRLLLYSQHIVIHKIQDTREGWVKAIMILVNSYLSGTNSYITIFDYSLIRKAGIPLKGFGGKASGSRPLTEGISIIRYLLENNIGKPLSSVLICDIVNVLATIVVAGNVRRSSQIFLSKNLETVEFKNYENPKYQYRMPWAWSSNNSIIIDKKASNNPQLFEKIITAVAKNVRFNGEPGLWFQDNVRHFGRIIDGWGDHDLLVNGVNPCGEIGLQGYSLNASAKPRSGGGETCNVSEIYISNYDGDLKTVIADIEKDLYYMVLYNKLVTIIPPHWKGTAEIQNHNRRIGIGQTGIQLFLAKHKTELEQLADTYSGQFEHANKYQKFLKGYAIVCDTWYKAITKYDQIISNLLMIPTSIKLTTIKPSGTVSICAGVTSGIHKPISQFYKRRVRFSKERTDLYQILVKNNYHVEEDVFQSASTWVVTFPVKYPYDIGTRQDYSIEEQFEILSMIQTYWADNQVSCTITFKESDGDKIAGLIMKYKNELKGLSMLPLYEGTHPQMPEESITESEYEELVKNIKPLKFNDFNRDHEIIEEEIDNYCSGDKCIKLN